MAKFTVFERVAADDLPRVVPPEFRGRAAALAERGAVYRVLLFAADRKQVVTSAPVRKALARASDAAAAPLVAVAANFTREALALLQGRGALVVRLGEYDWTDESYHAIRAT